MSQNPIILPTSGTVSGLQMTQAANAALDTLNTLASGPSAPVSPEAGQMWHDTTNNVLSMRSLDNSTWIKLFYLNETAYAAVPSPTGQNANRILNAEMLVDQQNEGGVYSITTNGNNYTLDQWYIGLQSGSFSGVNAQRSSDAPAGYASSLKLVVNTGTSSLGSSDFLTITQPIEGLNITDLSFGTANAVPFSLSFWVKSSVTGTFAVSLQNGSANRSLVNNFTITTANAWQQITLPNIPGDVTGTWSNVNQTGLVISITVAAGTGLQTSSLGVWQGANVLASTTQSNSVVLTSGSSIQLTGVIFNAGVFCGPPTKRIYSDDLLALQRYYEKTMPQGIAATTNMGLNGSTVASINSVSSFAHLGRQTFLAVKRTFPTIIFFNPVANNNNGNDSGGATLTALVADLAGDSTFGITANTSASGVGRGAFIHWTANARM